MNLALDVKIFAWLDIDETRTKKLAADASSRHPPAHDTAFR